ncbi:MAG: sigma-70 factor domain-containing protein, partial [Thermosynechococcaceae cyanobacterium]
MTQAKTVLEAIKEPVSDLEKLLGDTAASGSSRDENVAVAKETKAAKATKAKVAKRRGPAKKKHYTEDSIRLYLQEIGRIRLLRADEEIELARKIADLLELERVFESLTEKLDREPYTQEWADEVEMALPAFRHRLHLGRRAKDKMVQSN